MLWIIWHVFFIYMYVLYLFTLTLMSGPLATLKAMSRQHDLVEIDKDRPLRCIRKSYMLGLLRNKHRVLELSWDHSNWLESVLRAQNPTCKIHNNILRNIVKSQ